MSCGEPIPQEEVVIELVGIHNTDEKLLARASPYYFIGEANPVCDEHHLVIPEANLVINSGHGKNTFFADGAIDINLNSMINWNKSYINGPNPDQFDLRSVLLHEIFHVLGFAPKIG